jgi:hypothetical protein
MGLLEFLVGGLDPVGGDLDRGRNGIVVVLGQLLERLPGSLLDQEGREDTAQHEESVDFLADMSVMCHIALVTEALGFSAGANSPEHGPSTGSCSRLSLLLCAGEQWQPVQ